MNQKWNLQDIKPAEPRKRRVASGTTPEPAPRPREINREEDGADGTIEILDGNKRKSKSLIYAVAVFVCIVGAGIFASILMGGAEIAVEPRVKNPTINANFTATRIPQSEELTYEIMTLEAEGERQVTASGQETVESQAEGTILIYNKHQGDSLRLVTNTRFETSNGLIYKLKDPAVVPGYTTGNSGEIVPGILTAEVYAEAVGENYNVGPTEFTIPGFAGGPEFDNVYAESVEAMSGGFNGQRFIIDESELQTAQQALQMELRDSLLERVESELPAGFEYFKDAVTFTYVTLPSVESGDSLATIKEKALLRIPLFAKEAFAEYIAAAAIPGYEGEPVRINDITALTFAYQSGTTSASDISILNEIDFTVAGKPIIIWDYDEGRLKTDLVNKNKTALPTILTGYPAIVKAEAVIRPFWRTKFPDSLEEITINEIISTE